MGKKDIYNTFYNKDNLKKKKSDMGRKGVSDGRYRKCFSTYPVRSWQGHSQLQAWTMAHTQIHLEWEADIGCPWTKQGNTGLPHTALRLKQEYAFSCL